MQNLMKIALLGLAHGLSDCAAGFMIGMLPTITGGTLLETGSLVLLYNALAFGGQVPAGMVVDKSGNPKLFVVLSLAVVILAMAIYPFAPVIAITMAGFAGAFFHVSGGMLALLAFPGSTVGAGLFAAPGVMGITVGAFLAWQGIPAIWSLVAILAVVCSLILGLKMSFQDSPKPQGKDEAFEWHDFLMIVLLLAIAMRSAIWNLFGAIESGDHLLLLWMGAAAMLGKLAGGFAAQRFGWRRFGTIALMVAAPLLAFGGNRPLLLLPGICLLQSATPAAVLGMWRLMPRMPATAIGMSFGLAIAIGGIPMMAGWHFGNWWIILVIPLAGIGYWVAMRRMKSRT